MTLGVEKLVVFTMTDCKQVKLNSSYFVQTFIQTCILICAMVLWPTENSALVKNPWSRSLKTLQLLNLLLYNDNTRRHFATFLLFFSKNEMSLPNLTTLIPNIQSEFTYHVTLFCKIEFKFTQKRINKPNKHTFLFFRSISFKLNLAFYLLVWDMNFLLLSFFATSLLLQSRFRHQQWSAIMDTSNRPWYRDSMHLMSWWKR